MGKVRGAMGADTSRGRLPEHLITSARRAASVPAMSDRLSIDEYGDLWLSPAPGEPESARSRRLGAFEMCDEWDVPPDCHEAFLMLRDRWEGGHRSDERAEWDFHFVRSRGVR